MVSSDKGTNMRDVRNLTSKDIADDIVQLHNLSPTDRAAHEALLQEVNAYFKYNIDKIKQTEQGINPDSRRPYDVRGDVIALFNNVMIQANDNQWVDRLNPQDGSRAGIPISVEYFDSHAQGSQSVLNSGESPTNRNIIPTAFQISDDASRLSFTIKTNGDLNPDYTYQEFSKARRPFPYKTWSQYWGGSPASAAQYQPGQGKSKYEF